MRVALFALVLASCARSSSVQCDDGRTCPQNTLCDLVHHGCVTEEQTTACGSLIDGDVCHANGRGMICDASYCVPGCGDGTTDAALAEECDDGNFASHDGCSSACKVEARSWAQVQSPWRGRTGHATSYDSTNGKLVVFGGLDPDGAPAPTWIHDATTDTWTRQPSSPVDARRYTQIAYDSARGVHVVFGGIALTGDVLGDTWEFNDTTGVWTERTPAQSPPKRSQASLAYNPVRQRIVLFGGSPDPGFTTTLSDTWEWDGTTWTQLNSTFNPNGRIAAGLTWDALRSRLVLTAGAYSCDTWELPALQWSKSLLTSPNPNNQNACRFGAGFAYSPVHQKAVLFGGFTNFDLLSDTWEYGSGGWAQLQPPTAPSARQRATLTQANAAGDLFLVGGAEGIDLPTDVWKFDASTATGNWVPVPTNITPSPRASDLVYDDASKSIVMYGGDEGPAFAATDTWTFDGVSWTQHAASQPGDLRTHVLVYDARRDRVVMFGQRRLAPFQADQPTNEVWEWDGSTWTNATTSAMPPPRIASSLAFDREDGVVVLYGGQAIDGSALTDTWEYDGTTWTPVTTDLHPLAGQMAYDATRDAIVMFNATRETWLYKAHSWTQATPVHSPAQRQFEELMFDPVRGRVVLAGGLDNLTYYADLWEWTGNDWEEQQILGEPPPRRQTPNVAALPSARALVLFAGRRAAAGYFDDTWSLRFRSTTPDEDCTNGIDDDGDRQIDGADPDCR